MLAVVKKRRTKRKLFRISGDVPERVVKYLKRDYAVELVDDDSDLVDITSTDWYKSRKSSQNPFRTMRVC